ncbi:hypothetical protein RZN05_10765 [Sphingomonas sp. HF-S4]|uniref:Uncharacterized protein n=1 Tax=Sphingomonas agrestis TaxID=3080540 RepID=A0ABU3Y7Y4_9SPHN|nr:hypothetical protein [Sphingomonas sp. HF-S4]MDV3457466.1 hypothetical protein [Sphingomonas sp. HF-S4]
MLPFILGSILAVQDAKAHVDVFGKYLATNLTTKPACDKPGDRYLIINSKGLDWGDGKTYPLVRLEVGDRDHYHLWLNDLQTGKVMLYGVFIDRNHDHAIVISDERAEMQARVDQPGVADIGIAGYARCPS